MSNNDPKAAAPVELPVKAVNLSKASTIVARRVAWSGTSAERRRGLLGMQTLEADEGMYIAPTQWIHTFGMKFSIDIAFLAKDGKVVTVHHSLKPNRLSKISFRAEGALELAGGRLRATNTEIGDIIKFQDIDKADI